MSDDHNCGNIEMDEMSCRRCDGAGSIPLLVNRQGKVDFLDGQPNGVEIKCDQCNGEGVEQ